MHSNEFFESHLHVVRPGQALEVECMASGTPPPSLKWTLDDNPIEMNMEMAINTTVMVRNL